MFNVYLDNGLSLVQFPVPHAQLVVKQMALPVPCAPQAYTTMILIVPRHVVHVESDRSRRRLVQHHAALVQSIPIPLPGHPTAPIMFALPLVAQMPCVLHQILAHARPVSLALLAISP